MSEFEVTILKLTWIFNISVYMEMKMIGLENLLL